jgi:hypothetical protein
MRQVFAAALDRQVSVLGFGCASLGSRVSASEGLRALARAHDQGVTWFDVAPPYGDGKAEALLGQFLKGKRDQVAVCTKVGIAAPSLSLAARLAKPVLRTALKVVPQLRERISRHRPASTRAPINAAEIEASVTASLKRLNVDYVDVLALHEPSVDDVLNDEVRAALGRIVEKGYARTIGIAGERAVAEQGLKADPLYRMTQYADGPFEAPLAKQQALRVTHSVFGVGGALSKLSSALAQDSVLLGKLQDLGLSGTSSDIAAGALMDYALSNNRDGVVLTSMFRPEHLAFNGAHADRAPSETLVALLRGHAQDIR